MSEAIPDSIGNMINFIFLIAFLPYKVIIIRELKSKDPVNIPSILKEKIDFRI